MRSLNGKRLAIFAFALLMWFIGYRISYWFFSFETQPISEAQKIGASVFAGLLYGAFIVLVVPLTIKGVIHLYNWLYPKSKVDIDKEFKVLIKK